MCGLDFNFIHANYPHHHYKQTYHTEGVLYEEPEGSFNRLPQTKSVASILACYRVKVNKRFWMDMNGQDRMVIGVVSCSTGGRAIASNLLGRCSGGSLPLPFVVFSLKLCVPLHMATEDPFQDDL